METLSSNDCGIFIVPLPRNDERHRHYRHTGCWEGFRKYTTKVASGDMIYIPNFIKTGSGIQKQMREIYVFKFPMPKPLPSVL
jgi:hypothetical protein